MQKTTPLGNWIEEYSRFTFVENSLSNLPKVPKAKFQGSERLFCFISICKFCSFKNPFAMITGLSELYLRIRRFFSLVQTKKVISMNYGSSTSSWKPWRWMRLDLIFSMRDIYINSNLNPLTKFTSSNRSTEFKDIFPWNMSQMITKIIPISTRIVISNEVKWGILFWVWWKVNGNWDDNMIRTSQWRESHGTIVEQILASEDRNKSKRAETVRVTVRNLSRKVNHLNEVIRNGKIYSKVHQVYQFHQNRLVNLYGGH